MRFDIEQSIEVLSATPGTLRSLLGCLSADWTDAAGSEGEWRPFDVIGHLIHGEETDWIPRARLIFEQGAERTFVPFDRFAQFELSEGKTLGELLDEFAKRRAENLETLRSWNLTEEHLDLRGMHPELGEVALRQLLATWVVHDLNHILQIVTVMAARYGDDVGPWREYLSILK
ncbi:MAG: DinB family protein [Pyrinomonadaceae bacterium]